MKRYIVFAFDPGTHGGADDAVFHTDDLAEARIQVKEYWLLYRSAHILDQVEKKIIENDGFIRDLNIFE